MLRKQPWWWARKRCWILLYSIKHFICIFWTSTSYQNIQSPASSECAISSCIPFKVGSMLVFIDNVLIVNLKMAVVQDMLQSFSLSIISFCNDIILYEELKSHASTSFHKGFYNASTSFNLGFYPTDMTKRFTKITPATPFRVPYIYNTSILPELFSHEPYDFMVGCIITYFNGDCILN